MIVARKVENARAILRMARDGTGPPVAWDVEEHGWGKADMWPESQRITVLVVDDDGRFRRIVRAVLAEEDDIEVVGQAGDGMEGLALAQELVPDVVLLDIHMPVSDDSGYRGAGRGGTGPGGIEAARAISRQVPTTRVIMLTASDDEDDVYEALRAGASGYVVKDELLGDLAGVVRTMAHKLGMLLSPSIAAKVLTQLRDAPSRTTSPGLSERELEVLHLVSLGRTNDQIADELFLSSHTVKRHVANIMAKLHERTRADAVRHAVRNGYLAQSEPHWLRSRSGRDGTPRPTL